MERKLATVLFVDLVGSTALVTGSDPEVVRRRVNRFFEGVTHCVTTHGGIVESVIELELQARIGIESGEVVVDTAESTFATGEAVNLAARLQQAAAPMEILIGPAARSLAARP